MFIKTSNWLKFFSDKAILLDQWLFSHISKQMQWLYLKLRHKDRVVQRKPELTKKVKYII